MKPVLRALLVAAHAVVLSACDDPTRIEPEPLPNPFMSAALSGAIADSMEGTPQIGRFGSVIDDYEFQMFTDLRKGWYQFIQIWGEGPRPRVGTYRITPWREGEPGSRMHAMFSRDVPGGAAQYQALSGELRIITSTPEGIVGEFTFHGVPGYLLPEKAVLSPALPPLEVTGTFSVWCDGQEVCR